MVLVVASLAEVGSSYWNCLLVQTGDNLLDPCEGTAQDTSMSRDVATPLMADINE